MSRGQVCRRFPDSQSKYRNCISVQATTPSFHIHSSHPPRSSLCCWQCHAVRYAMYNWIQNSLVSPVAMKDTFNGGWLNRAATVFKLLGKWELRKWGKFHKLQYRACCCRLGRSSCPARFLQILVQSKFRAVQGGRRRLIASVITVTECLAGCLSGDRHSYGTCNSVGVRCLLASSCPLYVRWLQIQTHWTDFVKIWYFRQQCVR